MKTMTYIIIALALTIGCATTGKVPPPDCQWGGPGVICKERVCTSKTKLNAKGEPRLDVQCKDVISSFKREVR